MSAPGTPAPYDPDQVPPSYVPGGDGPDSRSDFVPDVGGVRPYDPRLTVDRGRFLGGALATALVTALVGLVGAILVETVLGIDLVPTVGSGGNGATFALAGALLALLAAGVLVLLVVATPRPRLFFGWLMALTTVVVALLPFSSTDDLGRAVCTALVNLVMAVAVWSLLSGVASRTVEPRSGERPPIDRRGQQRL